MTNQEIRIRRIELHELDQMIDLCEKHAAYEKAAYSSDGKLEKLKLALFGDAPVLSCFVAALGEELIGYITFTKEFSTWSAAYYFHMDCIYLKENARKLGVGKKLITAMKEVASKEGIDQIQWQTPTDNTNAIDFYHHIGAISKEKSRFFLAL